MTQHHPRYDWNQYERTAPAVINALRALGAAVDESGLDKSLTELIKVRASQINGCAFCIQFHLNTARKLGVATEKLDLLQVWHEVDLFNPREQAALLWAETLTLMANRTVSDRQYEQLQAQFSSSEIAHLTAAIAAINAWNRIAGALQFPPPIPRKGQV